MRLGICPFAPNQIRECAAVVQLEANLCAVFGAQLVQVTHTTQRVLLPMGVFEQVASHQVFKACAFVAPAQMYKTAVIKAHLGLL